MRLQALESDEERTLYFSSCSIRLAQLFLNMSFCPTLKLSIPSTSFALLLVSWASIICSELARNGSQEKINFTFVVQASKCAFLYSQTTADNSLTSVWLTFIPIRCPDTVVSWALNFILVSFIGLSSLKSSMQELKTILQYQFIQVLMCAMAWQCFLLNVLIIHHVLWVIIKYGLGYYQLCSGISLSIGRDIRLSLTVG